MVDGKTVIPVGATVQGRVTKTNEPRRIAGKPTIAIFPENLVLPNGERFMLNATLVDTNRGRGTDVNTEGQFKGAGHDGKDLTEIGMGTGGGMLIGGLIGGGKGMLIGGAVGATATVAHWLGKHRSATLPAGTELVMELNRPMAMTSPSRRTVEADPVLSSQSRSYHEPENELLRFSFHIATRQIVFRQQFQLDPAFDRKGVDRQDDSATG